MRSSNADLNANEAGEISNFPSSVLSPAPPPLLTTTPPSTTISIPWTTNTADEDGTSMVSSLVPTFSNAPTFNEQYAQIFNETNPLDTDEIDDAALLNGIDNENVTFSVNETDLFNGIYDDNGTTPFIEGSGLFVNETDMLDNGETNDQDWDLNSTFATGDDPLGNITNIDEFGTNFMLEGDDNSFVNATLVGYLDVNATAIDELDTNKTNADELKINVTNIDELDANATLDDDIETISFPTAAISSTAPASEFDVFSTPYTLKFSMEGRLPSSRFGSSVALSADGNLMAVGASEAMNDAGEATGAVYLYSFEVSDDNTYSAPPQLLNVIYGQSSGDEFGNAVALSHDGNRIVIGSRSEADLAGAIRVYQRSTATTSWEQLGEVTRGQNPMDRAGWSVAISGDGNIVAMGSPTSIGGSVVCYRVKDGSDAAWEPYGSSIEGLPTGEAAGYAISLSYDGFLMAVGYPKAENLVGSSNAGKTAVYYYVGEWSLIAPEVYGEATDDIDGTSVALSQDGSVLVTGAKGRDGDDSSLTNNGYCRIYMFSNRQFELIYIIEGENAEERMGSYVAVSSDGNTIACGGTNGNWNGVADSGVVRLWNRSTLQESTIWPRGETASAFEGATFGVSLALSSDGQYVVIGAPAFSSENAGSMTGIVQSYFRPTNDTLP